VRFFDGSTTLSLDLLVHSDVESFGDGLKYVPAWHDNYRIHRDVEGVGDGLKHVPAQHENYRWPQQQHQFHHAVYVGGAHDAVLGNQNSPHGAGLDVRATDFGSQLGGTADL
jgi:hypothetical protein